MAANLTIAAVIEKNKISSDKSYPLLVEIDVRQPGSTTVVETLRFCDDAQDVVWAGNTYTAFPFTVDLKAELGEAPELSLTFQDPLGAVRQRQMDYGGGVGFIVRIIAVNADAPTQPEMSETFRVIDSTASNYTVTFKIGSENPITFAFPRRRQFRESCSWIYKSAQCGYTGGLATCDRSLRGANGCQAHNNAQNFGGFPSLT